MAFQILLGLNLFALEVYLLIKLHNKKKNKYFNAKKYFNSVKKDNK